MEKKKSKSSVEPKEEPVINIVDRRSALLDDETVTETESDIEERLPTYVEKLKHEAEEKDTC